MPRRVRASIAKAMASAGVSSARDEDVHVEAAAHGSVSAGCDRVTHSSAICSSCGSAPPRHQRADLRDGGGDQAAPRNRRRAARHRASWGRLARHQHRRRIDRRQQFDRSRDRFRLSLGTGRWSFQLPSRGLFTGKPDSISPVGSLAICLPSTTPADSLFVFFLGGGGGVGGLRRGDGRGKGDRGGIERGCQGRR